MMSTQDVKKYFEMLITNEEFAKKIIETGEDKAAKMTVVKKYGLNFTKEDYLEYRDECLVQGKKLGIKPEDIAKQLEDELLENVSGGGVVSTPGVLAGGAVGTAVQTVAAGFLGAGYGAFVGLGAGPAAVVVSPVLALGLGVTSAGLGFAAGVVGTAGAAGLSLFSLF